MFFLAKGFFFIKNIEKLKYLFAKKTVAEKMPRDALLLFLRTGYE